MSEWRYFGTHLRMYDVQYTVQYTEKYNIIDIENVGYVYYCLHLNILYHLVPYVPEHSAYGW